MNTINQEEDSVSSSESNIFVPRRQKIRILDNSISSDDHEDLIAYVRDYEKRIRSNYDHGSNFEEFNHEATRNCVPSSASESNFQEYFHEASRNCLSSSASESDFQEYIHESTPNCALNSDHEYEEYIPLCVPWIWKQTVNTPTIWNFSGASGITAFVLNQLNRNADLLELFAVLFDDDFWNLLVFQTNIYANQTISDKKRRKKVDDTWFPVTTDEIKAYYALVILMSQVRKSKLQMYWTRREAIETSIFRRVMPFKRFKQISRFLHFVDNESSDNNSRLWKIKPIVDYFNNKFLNIYKPGENVTIDESLMKYRGRLPHKQFNPSKRARFGIKIYKLCESNTGYCSQFKIYTGEDRRGPSESASQNVVMHLSKSIINKGHTLYLDNWYSSPQLFLTLNKLKTNVIGTVNRNRKTMPKTLSLKQLNKGEYVFQSCNGVLAVRWKDKRDVYLLSTKHDIVNLVEVTNKRSEKIWKPSCVQDYNNCMGGVDLQDQMLACFPIMRKVIRGYIKIFFYITDMAMFNLYVMYKSLQTRQCSYVNFRIIIAEELIKDIQLPNYRTRGRQYGNSETLLRLQAQYWAHFPKHINPTACKQHPTRTCKVCAKHKKRSETTWECDKCKVALHVPKCFKSYHTLKEY